jgi:hypothetical protein
MWHRGSVFITKLHGKEFEGGDAYLNWNNPIDSHVVSEVKREVAASSVYLSD